MIGVDIMVGILFFLAWSFANCGSFATSKGLFTHLESSALEPLNISYDERTHWHHLLGSSVNLAVRHIFYFSRALSFLSWLKNLLTML
uniref:Putative secreted protein n=1 Tax=Ixodes ricinus TaxID=34613 RepID=A0A6B0U9T1_IXORI